MHYYTYRLTAQLESKDLIQDAIHRPQGMKHRECFILIRGKSYNFKQYSTQVNFIRQPAVYRPACTRRQRIPYFEV